MKYRGVAVTLAFALTGSCSRSDGGAPAPAQGGGPPAAPVEVGVVGDGAISDTWNYLGQVQPALESELAAGVAGHVTKVTVREGDEVKQNQVLLALDNAQTAASLAAARARVNGLATELAQAERQLARVGKLDFPTVSEPERERYALAVDSTRASLEAARAEVQRLQVELSRHVVRAPFPGVIKARHIDPGAWVSVGQPVLGLISLEDTEVHVDVSAELGKRVQLGDVAYALGEPRAPLEIVGIVPALDTTTRTMRVRLVPTERPPWLLPGLAVDVAFAVSFEGGVTVPSDALVRGPVSTRVLKLQDGAGVPIDVEVLADAKGRALVRASELAPGDRVITRGNERLRPGQPLQVVN